MEINAEMAVLGCILRDGNLIEELSEFCDLDDFLDNRINAAMTAAYQLSNQGTPPEYTALCDYYSKAANHADWVRYLGRIMSNTVGDMRVYAARVRQNADIRRLQEAASEVLQICSDPQRAFESKLDLCQQKILNAVERKQDSIKDSKKQLTALVKDIESKLDSKVGVGIDLGFEKINAAIGMARPGELITIAGRPGMGKTNLALNIFSSILNNDKTAIYFSMEMVTDELLSRLAADWSNTYYSKFHDASLDDGDWARFQRLFVEPYHSKKSFIDDASTQTTGSIRAKSRRIQKQHGLDIIFVDHIGLMTHGLDNDTQGLTKISREMKRIAKDLNCVVVLLSQLNRDCERRNNKRPMMSDLRQCGAIEEDSDVIGLLYRDDYYTKKETNIAELNIAKARKGKTGIIPLATEFGFCRFRDTDREPEPFKQENKRGMKF